MRVKVVGYSQGRELPALILEAAEYKSFDQAASEFAAELEQAGGKLARCARDPATGEWVYLNFEGIDAVRIIPA